MEVSAALKRCDVLLGLNDEALAKIASLPSCHTGKCEAGANLFKEGNLAEHFYLLDEGKVNLIMEATGDPPRSAVVETVTKGGVFGWSALVPPHILTHSAVCVEPSRVVVINGEELARLMDNDPSIGYEVMRGLVRVIGSRLRHTQRLFISTGRAMIL